MINKNKIENTHRLLDMRDALGEAVYIIDSSFEVNESKTSMSLEYINLDRETIEFQLGDLTFIESGDASSWRHLMTKIINHKSILEHKNIGLVTLSCTPTQFTMELVSLISEVPLNYLSRGRLTDEEWPKLTNAIARLNESSIYFAKDTIVTKNSLSDNIAVMVEQQQITQVFIDDIGLIQGDNDEVINELRNLAQINNIAIIAGDLPILTVDPYFYFVSRS